MSLLDPLTLFARAARPRPELSAGVAATRPRAALSVGMAATRLRPELSATVAATRPQIPLLMQWSETSLSTDDFDTSEIIVRNDFQYIGWMETTFAGDSQGDEPKSIIVLAQDDWT